MHEKENQSSYITCYCFGVRDFPMLSASTTLMCLIRLQNSTGNQRTVPSRSGAFELNSSWLMWWCGGDMSPTGCHGGSVLADCQRHAFSFTLLMCKKQSNFIMACFSIFFRASVFAAVAGIRLRRTGLTQTLPRAFKWFTILAAAVQDTHMSFLLIAV